MNLSELKKFLTKHFFLGNSINVAPPQVAHSIKRHYQPMAKDEVIICICAADWWKMRGQFWVLISNRQIIVYNNPAIKTAYFCDMHSVNLSKFNNIIVTNNVGRPFKLFSVWEQMPSKRQLRFIYNKIRTQIENLRRCR